MPQMGESIAEGTLSKWLKKVGDDVKRDEPIFEISTDKVDAEIPAPSNGVLAEILVTEGQTVAVQTVVARLETEKGAAIATGGGSAPVAQPGLTERPTPKPAPPAVASGSAAPGRGAAPNPPANAQTPRGAGASAPQPNGDNSFEERLRTKSSPLVRKIAADHGIELSAM